jgi:Na+-driven multidrug efflux pump
MELTRENLNKDIIKLALPVAYVFGILLKWGFAGIWFAVALDRIFRSIAVSVIFKLGR